MYKKIKRVSNSRGALQISFAWLFALIVGAFILFLAIFMVMKFAGTGDKVIDAETATQIGIILNPLETGFEAARSPPPMVLAAESRNFD